MDQDCRLTGVYSGLIINVYLLHIIFHSTNVSSSIILPQPSAFVGSASQIMNGMAVKSSDFELM